MDSRVHLSQHRLQHSPDVLGQDALAGGVGMDAVPLVERGIPRNAFEEKRDEGRSILLRETGEHRAEGAHVILARKPGQLHPGDDNRSLRMLGAGLINYRLQIIADLADLYAPKNIVDPEFQHENIDLLV